MGNEAIALSESLASAVEAVGKSVVRVDGRRGTPSSGVIFSNEGLILTAEHTLEVDDGIAIGLPDGQEVSARVKGRDPSTDLALLQVQGKLSAPAIEWKAESEAGVKVGHLILAVARPGRSVRARLGIASVLGPSFQTPGGGQIDRYFQADLDPFPGLSGGIWVDAAGHPLALATSGLLRGRALGIGPATLLRVGEALLRDGRIRRGYLGVGVYPVRLPRAVGSAGGSMGAMLISVAEDSPADKGGLLPGDILIDLGGRPIAQPSDLLARLGQESVGSTLEAKIWRAGQVQAVQLTVGARE